MGNSVDPGKPKIFPILLVNFIGTMGYSLLLPLLVVLVTRFEGDEIFFGILGATYSFFQFIGAPIMGKWSDKIGRRRVLLISQTGTFLAWLLFLAALVLPNRELVEIGAVMVTVPLLVLFLARALDGLTGGNVSVANAYLADVSTDENRAANFGKMGVASNLGTVAGPILAGVLGTAFTGQIAPVLGALAISLAAIFVIAIGLPESEGKSIEQPLETPTLVKTLGQELKEGVRMEGEKKHSLRQVMKIPHVGYILTFSFVVGLAFSFFSVSFPILALEEFKWGTSELGIFFSAFGGLMVLSQGPMLGWLSKRLKETQLIPLGLLLIMLGFVAFAVGGVVMACVGGGLLAVGISIASPSFMSLLARAAGSRYQGAVQGQSSSLGSLASIIGLLAGGLVYSYLGNLTYAIPAVFILLLLASSVRLKKIDEDLTQRPSA